MTNLQRRLRKLETKLTDRSGFVPHSKEWFRYWNGQMDIFLSGRDENAMDGMTLEVIDAIVAAGEEAEIHAEGDNPTTSEA